MSAADLARVKRTYPLWSIRAVRPGMGDGYTAQRWRGGDNPPLTVHSLNLTELEGKLYQLAHPHASQAVKASAALSLDAYEEAS